MVGRFWMSFLNHIIRMVWSLGEAGWHQSFKDQRLPGYSLAVGQNFGLPTTAWNRCCQDSHQTGSTTEGCKSLVATSTSQWVATASTTWPTWILASWQQVDQYTSLAKGFPIFLGAVSRNTWRSPCFPTRLEFGRVLTYLHSWRCLPIFIHGDEGRGLARRPWMCISWQPVISFKGMDYVNDSSQLVIKYHTVILNVNLRVICVEHLWGYHVLLFII